MCLGLMQGRTLGCLTRQHWAERCRHTCLPLAEPLPPGTSETVTPIRNLGSFWTQRSPARLSHKTIADSLPPDTSKTVTTIRNSGARLLNLINDILDAAALRKVSASMSCRVCAKLCEQARVEHGLSLLGRTAQHGAALRQVAGQAWAYHLPSTHL